jgi:hypothetical protein
MQEIRRLSMNLTNLTNITNLTSLTSLTSHVAKPHLTTYLILALGCVVSFGIFCYKFQTGS